MKRRTLQGPRAAAALGMLLTTTFAATAAAQAYRAVDFTPPGTQAEFAAVEGGGRVAGTVRSGSVDRAALWDLAAPVGPGNPVDLHPAGFVFSRIIGAGGGQQVGYGKIDVGGDGVNEHALLWRGQADTVVDLHPDGATFSHAHDADGAVQVGMARFGGIDHNRHSRAILWRGSATGYVNLTPTGANAAEALAVADGRQAGVTYWPGEPDSHATLWSGTSDSFVDLHPAGFDSSGAADLAGDQQAGYAQFIIANRINRRAVLWTGSAAGAVNLHPDGYDQSFLAATNGSQQVGSAARPRAVPLLFHAMVWSGTADSAVDLHELLPPQFTASMANDIDEAGNVYGIAFEADGREHAVAWQVVPEPSCLALLSLATAGLVRRRVRVR